MKIKFSFPDEVLSSMETNDYRELINILNVLLLSRSEIVSYTYSHDIENMAMLFGIETKASFVTPQEALKAILPLGYEKLENYIVSQ